MYEQKMNYEYDVYISFHPKQLCHAQNTCRLFKNADLKVWFVEDSTNKFDENIHALQNSYIFVCFLSDEFHKAIRNRIEHSIAVGQNMKMMSFVNSDYKVNEPIKMVSSDSISFNLNSMNDAKIELLAKSIKNEMEKNSRNIILRKTTQEMENAFHNFKKLYEKTIDTCEFLDKKKNF